MANDTKTSKLSTPDVVDYYARNWDKIANCYALDDQGLPVDPAWYRRRLYKDFLARSRPMSVLDIGCGGGWTVLDACEQGLDPRGIEPVAQLQAYGRSLLERHGHDPQRIQQGDLSVLATLKPASLDCVALLSVLPHVPRDLWDEVHRDIARVLRPGGRLIAAYRNELFDLYTFNSFTMEFYDRSLWGNKICLPLRVEAHLAALKGLITHSDVPGPYFTTAHDKSFGQLDRMKSNPLVMPSYLSRHGLVLERTSFYHFHCVPPLMATAIPEYRRINHEMELTMATDWRGNFMAAMFLVEAVKGKAERTAAMAPPLPVDERQRRRYDARYFSAYTDDPQRTIMYRVERGRIERFKPAGRILDVGCGLGSFLAEFSPERWQRYGVDVSDFAIERSRARGIHVNDVSNAYDYPDESFDVIVFRGSLQLIPTPFTVIETCVRLLAPDGYMVFLSTPNSNSPYYRRFKTLPFLTPEANFLIPSDVMMRHALQNFGLEVVEIRYPYLETPYARPLRDLVRYLLGGLGIKTKFAFWRSTMEIYARKPGASVDR